MSRGACLIVLNERSACGCLAAASICLFILPSVPCRKLCVAAYVAYTRRPSWHPPSQGSTNETRGSALDGWDTTMGLLVTCCCTAPPGSLSSPPEVDFHDQRPSSALEIIQRCVSCAVLSSTSPRTSKAFSLPTPSEPNTPTSLTSPSRSAPTPVQY